MKGGNYGIRKTLQGPNETLKSIIFFTIHQEYNKTNDILLLSIDE